ncbi:MAG: M16 family metallopeptidase [Candidatus Kryptoniota bacterium]
MTAMVSRRRKVSSKRRQPLIRINVDFQKFTLDNGLTVILRQDKRVPVVAVNVGYHVGSKNESPGKTGFAHLFEHLMFEGSKNVKKGEFDKFISLAGGYNNAFTTEDVTNYYEVVPSNQLELALWLESDRMLQFSITEEALKTQREVVKEEKRWRIDNRPYGDAPMRIQELLFPTGQYHWPVIGSMEDIDSASMEDVKEFYEKYYRPDNAVLVISGDISYSKGKEAVEKYFSEIPRGGTELPALNFVDVPLNGEAVQEVRSSVPSPALFVAYKIPQEGTEDYYAMNQVSKILSDGDSSRLYKRLVYETQAASDFDVSTEGLEKSGVFAISAFATPGHTAEELLELIDDEIKKMKETLVTNYEFEKAQNSSVTSYVGRLSTNSGVAELLAHYEMIFQSPDLINSEVDRELSVSRQSMRDATQRLLNENRVVLFYKPLDMQEYKNA